MTSYRTTMREALEAMNEDNLAKMRKAAGGAKQTLKMKDGSIGMDSFSASAIMQIYDKINDKNKKTFENMMKNGKKADIVKLQKFAMSKVNASYEEFEEEFELDEAPAKVWHLANKKFNLISDKGGYILVKQGSGEEKRLKAKTPADATAELVKKGYREEFELDEAKYELYHKDFSSAMQHSYKMAKKLHGITVDPEEIDDKVASGPKKPSEGKTNSYRLEGDKGAIQVQVYNKGGSKPFELNFYKEEVELDEKKTITLFKNKQPTAYDRMRRRMNPKDRKTVDASDEKQIKDLESRGWHRSPYDEEVEEGAAADARRAMRNDPDMKQRAFSKDVSSTDDDEKAASKNIMMQLRKAVSLRSYDVEFADGKKQKVNQKIAQAVQNKYNSMRRPADKEKFQAQIAKSYKDMLKTIKSGYGEQKESILEKIDRKIKENKNG